MHCVALSRPMDTHDKKIAKSIDLNIIRIVKMVKVCSNYKIKLRYFSTKHIYPGKIDNYNEYDSVLSKIIIYGLN